MGRGGSRGGLSIFLEIQEQVFNRGIGRMFPEKMVKIRSVVPELLLLIC